MKTLYQCIKEAFEDRPAKATNVQPEFVDIDRLRENGTYTNRIIKLILHIINNHAKKVSFKAGKYRDWEDVSGDTQETLWKYIVSGKCMN